MASRIQADAHVVLGLEIGQRRALGDQQMMMHLEIKVEDLPAGQTGRT